MLSDWKNKTCSAGASCSHTQGFVRNPVTSSRWVKSTSEGRATIDMRFSSTSRLNGAEVGRVSCVVNRKIGHPGPKTDAKCSKRGTRGSRARFSIMAATLSVITAPLAGSGAGSGSETGKTWEVRDEELENGCQKETRNMAITKLTPKYAIIRGERTI